MDHGGEKKIITCLHSQQDLSYLKVSAAAHRKKLRKALDKAQQYRLEPIHDYFSSLSLNIPMIATTSMTIPRIITRGAATIRRKSNIA